MQLLARGAAIEPGHVHARHPDAGVDPVGVATLVREQGAGPDRQGQHEAGDDGEDEPTEREAAGGGWHLGARCGWIGAQI